MSFQGHDFSFLSHSIRNVVEHTQFSQIVISFSPESLIQSVELGSCKILLCSYGNVNNFSSGGKKGLMRGD